MVKLDMESIREKVTVAVIALFVGLAVYSFLGFAWTFKSAVEASQKAWRSI